MKKIIFILFLFCSFSVAAENNNNEKQIFSQGLAAWGKDLQIIEDKGLYLCPNNLGFLAKITEGEDLFVIANAIASLAKAAESRGIDKKNLSALQVDAKAAEKSLKKLARKYKNGQEAKKTGYGLVRVLYIKVMNDLIKESRALRSKPTPTLQDFQKAEMLMESLSSSNLKEAQAEYILLAAFKGELNERLKGLEAEILVQLADVSQRLGGTVDEFESITTALVHLAKVADKQQATLVVHEELIKNLHAKVAVLEGKLKTKEQAPPKGVVQSPWQYLGAWSGSWSKKEWVFAVLLIVLFLAFLGTKINVWRAAKKSMKNIIPETLLDGSGRNVLNIGRLPNGADREEYIENLKNGAMEQNFESSDGETEHDVHVLTALFEEGDSVWAEELSEEDAAWLYEATQAAEPEPNDRDLGQANCPRGISSGDLRVVYSEDGCGFDESTKELSAEQIPH